MVFNRSWECMEYGCGGVSSLEVCEVLNFINHGSVRNVGVGVYVSSLEVCGCGLYNALVCMEFEGV